jgi:Fe-Mn family superoxide dismutase
MYKQIQLSYDFNALEPYIDELTMITHYSKHHAAYTNNLNASLEKLPAFAGNSIEDILSNLQVIEDEALRTAVRNNGGGFYNHNLYFGILSPNAKKAPSGELADKINADFGSLDALKDRLSALAAGRFGSGWAWLSVDREGKLHASSSPNQDNPMMDGNGHIPILGIDVWEHAYYLKYKNLRADYIKAFWEVLDWSAVEKLYESAKGGCIGSCSL